MLRQLRNMCTDISNAIVWISELTRSDHLPAWFLSLLPRFPVSSGTEKRLCRFISIVFWNPGLRLRTRAYNPLFGDSIQKAKAQGTHLPNTKSLLKSLLQAYSDCHRQQRVLHRGPGQRWHSCKHFMEAALAHSHSTVTLNLRCPNNPYESLSYQYLMKTVQLPYVIKPMYTPCLIKACSNNLYPICYI